jgi:hypothetical protein
VRALARSSAACSFAFSASWFWVALLAWQLGSLDPQGVSVTFRHDRSSPSVCLPLGGSVEVVAVEGRDYYSFIDFKRM